MSAPPDPPRLPHRWVLIGIASLLTGVLTYLLTVFPFDAQGSTGGGAAVVAAIAMAAFLHSALE